MNCKNRVLTLISRLTALLLALLLLGSTALADVSFPSDLLRIETRAFMNATLLSGTLHLPEGLTYIGEKAFYNCKNLTGMLTIPASVEYIGSMAFANCTGLSGYVVIPASVKYLAPDAFSGTKVTVLGGPGSGESDLPGGSIGGGEDDEGGDEVITITNLRAR